jgi:capsular exopolysaccharide synthesis family protein
VFLPIFAFCILAAIIYLRIATPLYTAICRIDVAMALPPIVGAAEAAERPDAENFLNSQSQLIGSSAVLSRVLERDEIRGMQTFAGASDPLTSLQKQLVVAPGRRDNLITISLESPSREEATRIVDAVVDAYLEHLRMRRQTTSAELVRIIELERQARATELAQRREAMLRYKQENETLSFVNEKGNIALERLAQLATAATEAEIETIQTAAAYEAGKAIFENPANEGYLTESLLALVRGVEGGDDEIAALRESAQELEVQVAARERTLGENSTALRRDRQLLADLKARLREEDRAAATAWLEVLKQSWLFAQEKQTVVQAALEKERAQALQMDSVAMKFQMLEADVEQSQRVIDNLDTRLSDLRLTQDAGALSVHVVDPARADAEPTNPSKGLTLATAGALGLMLGTGGAFLRNATDRRMRTPQEVMRTLRLPIVCGVPHIQGRTAAQRGTAALLKPDSQAAEAFRMIRTAIYFGRNRQQKSLMITSAAPNDGKSTVASNLAITLAQAGDRTVMVDADLRRGSQHIIFGVSNAVGLSNLLAGQAELSDVIQRTGHDNLDLLPSGGVPSNPSELLNSPKFAALLRHLSKWYDRIILDAPPTAGLADPLILGAISDGTLLVIRPSRSSRSRSEAMCASLSSVGARFIGIVANDVPSSGMAYVGGYADPGYYAVSRPSVLAVHPAQEPPALAALRLTDIQESPLADLLSMPVATFNSDEWTVRADPGPATGSIHFRLSGPEGQLAWEHIGKLMPQYLFGEGPAGPNPPPTALARAIYSLEVTPYRLPGGPHNPGNVAGTTQRVTLDWRKVWKEHSTMIEVPDLSRFDAATATSG